MELTVTVYSILTLILTLDRSVDELVADFELGLQTAAVDNYSRRLVEFCSLQALQVITSIDLGDKIHDGSLSRFTFDMMLAWETPTPSDQQITMESIAKEREDRKEPLGANEAVMGDETSLFYSDIMPLLVNEEPTVGEDTYVWFGSVRDEAREVTIANAAIEGMKEEGLAAALAVIPFKYVLIGLTAGGFMSNTRIARAMSNPHGSRRWREWWESIPAVPVRAVDMSDL
ncbi:hypothetical protein E2562_030681 [Oryza meyeriana var. granulata]|uniref:Uncharacterized protein n=1 Tax=Oryza meyeriana var. granulata TaxID=110450 RepID=A0A6G1DP57_9ORYZ|nr:hypothetical protein E2562_030681 [Oryza meyeriana var. granulata]